MEVPLRPPTYMDDLVLTLSADQPPALLAKTMQATAALVAVMARHGLVVNFKAGNTECLLYLAGCGAAAARARLWEALPLVDGVPVLGLAGGQGLRVVASYKHLGITATTACTFGPELEARLAGGRVATVALSQQVFGW